MEPFGGALVLKRSGGAESTAPPHYMSEANDMGARCSGLALLLPVRRYDTRNPVQQQKCLLPVSSPAATRCWAELASLV